MRNDIVDSRESKTTSWFKRFIGREQKPEVTWPFPFVEGRLFILTLRAGVDGYHISIGGRHVTSFPYRTVSNVEKFVMFTSNDIDLRLTLLENAFLGACYYRYSICNDTFYCQILVFQNNVIVLTPLY